MHLKHVNEALHLLGKAGLSLKLIKCHFFKEAVNYLGHVIRPGKLAVAEKNTAALRNALYPRHKRNSVPSWAFAMYIADSFRALRPSQPP